MSFASPVMSAKEVSLMRIHRHPILSASLRMSTRLIKSAIQASREARASAQTVRKQASDASRRSGA